MMTENHIESQNNYMLTMDSRRLLGYKLTGYSDYQMFIHNLCAIAATKAATGSGF
jgi:flagellar biosynthesis chaperone FliJ